MKKKLLKNCVLALFVTVLLINNIYSFGQNKVQYEKLSWKYLQSKHFSLFLHQDQSDIPYIALRTIEESYNQLSKRFEYNHKEKLPLIIYGNPNLFAQTNIITEILPEEVGGFTELLKNRIAIPFNGSYNELRHVLHHELVHAFQFGILNDQIGGGMFTSGIQAPFWFMEGSAEYLSSGWSVEADMFLLDKTIHSSIPLPGPELNGYMAYKGGQSFLFYLESSKGDSAFSEFLKAFRKSKNVDLSLKKIYGKSSNDLGKEWIRELKRIYWPEIGRRIDPIKNSHAITSHVDTRDHFNLRPRIAPNCSTIAFFSDNKDRPGIVIADIEGNIKHNISQNGYGGYFESFHPFRSGMCWSPDSRFLAFVTKDNGRDEIRIIDIEKKKLHRTIKTKLPYINSPDWSSQGSHLVFSGVYKGYSDLYLFDLSNDTLIQLTSSIQVESNPRFSPNGIEILYSMKDTNLSLKDPFSAYGQTPSDLQLLNISTRKIRTLSSTPWNEKQACFSPDGNNIAFISDRNGIDNIYISTLDSISSANAITNYIGSCSNPDWAGSYLAFGLFQHEGWDIHLIDSPISKKIKDTLAVTRWIESRRDSSIHFFLPSPIFSDSLKSKNYQQNSDSSSKKTIEPIVHEKDTTSSVGIVIQSDSELVVADLTVFHNNQADTISPTSTLKNNSDSLETKDSSIISNISKTRPSPVPYRIKFSPDVVSLGVGMSTFYTPAGQAMISLSDVMGDHRLTFAGDIQGNFKEYLHFFGSYIFLRERLDIGFGGLVSKDYSYSGIFAERLFHDVETTGFLMTQYPFSLFSRIDFNLFVSHLRRELVQIEGPTIESTTFLPSIKYVFDNTLWGLTGPIYGIRASGTLLSSPPFKFIDNPYISLDVDIRHYLHIVKRFVWANRFFAGASIPLSNQPSARRYFLGGNENWIFYDVNTNQYNNNISNTSHSDFITPLRGWKYLDITGTKTILMNSEFRFPFVREISLAWPLPIRVRYINGAVFIDAGNAWDKGKEGSKISVPDNFFGGFGFGMRANLGIFLLRFDRGWATDWKSINSPVSYFSLGAEF